MQQRLPSAGRWLGRRSSLASTTFVAYDPQPLVKRVFNTAQTDHLAAAVERGVFVLLRRRGRSGRTASRICCSRFLPRSSCHCVVNGTARRRHRVALHQGVPVRVVFQGTMAGIDPGLRGLRPVRAAAGRALGRGRGRRRADGGDPAAAAAVRRAVGLRAVRRGAARLRPHRARPDDRGRDQGPLHPRPQRAGLRGVGAHRPGDRHARGPRAVPALRRDAARRRQARGPHPGAAEERRPHRGRARVDPAAPGAGRRDHPRDRVPRRGRGRHPAPPRAARRPRLPDGPGRRRHPGVRPGDRGRRRVRLDDDDPLLPRRAHRHRGDDRAAALRGRPVRPAHGRGARDAPSTSTAGRRTRRRCTPPPADEPFDQEAGAFDHDDPTSALLRDRTS